jgi:hypothetical protein
MSIYLHNGQFEILRNEQFVFNLNTTFWDKNTLFVKKKNTILWKILNQTYFSTLWMYVENCFLYLQFAQFKYYYLDDDTESDQNVIDEWDPTILLETPYDIIMIL